VHPEGKVARLSLLDPARVLHQQLLLENPRQIEPGEPGNLAFRVRRSIHNPNEFWHYEPWAAQEAVEAHESGAAFAVQEGAASLVEPDSVLFGNCVPVKVPGHSTEPSAAASTAPES